MHGDVSFDYQQECRVLERSKNKTSTVDLFIASMMATQYTAVAPALCCKMPLTCERGYSTRNVHSITFPLFSILTHRYPYRSHPTTSSNRRPKADLVQSPLSHDTSQIGAEITFLRGNLEISVDDGHSK